MSGPISGPLGGWQSGPVTDRAYCVLAPNPSPMTLDGTNTWVLHEPGSTSALVVDPGPLHDGHLRAVLDVVASLGARVTGTLLTHGHHDHSAGAARFAELSGGPVRALDPLHRSGSEGLVQGEVLAAGGLQVEVVATPGHTWDSLSFLLPGDDALLTGDVVLGRGTAAVAAPDGDLADYLSSLHRMAELTRSGQVTTLLPGHGPVLPDATATVEYYLTHRQERIEQVGAALAAGARTAREVVERVYADVDRALWPTAEDVVRTHLEYLTGRS